MRCERGWEVRSAQGKPEGGPRADQRTQGQMLSSASAGATARGMIPHAAINNPDTRKEKKTCQKKHQSSIHDNPTPLQSSHLASTPWLSLRGLRPRVCFLRAVGAGLWVPIGKPSESYLRRVSSPALVRRIRSRRAALYALSDSSPHASGPISLRGSRPLNSAAPRQQLPSQRHGFQDRALWSVDPTRRLRT